MLQSRGDREARQSTEFSNFQPKLNGGNEDHVHFCTIFLLKITYL